MSATRIEFQPRVGDVIRAYNRSLSASQQPPSIPATFCDSMAVREQVFVNEMKAVPLEYHMDTDDARSFHWVLYSLPTSSSDGSNQQQSQTIGMIRLVPFPHYPHPEPEARYEAPTEEVPVESSKTFFFKPPPNYVVDRETSLHDGREPYLKLGRLCVVKEFRGKKAADQLVQAALR